MRLLYGVPSFVKPVFFDRRFKNEGFINSVEMVTAILDKLYVRSAVQTRSLHQQGGTDLNELGSRRLQELPWLLEFSLLTMSLWMKLFLGYSRNELKRTRSRFSTEVKVIGSS